MDKYLQEQFISNKLIEVNAQYDGYPILKDKFDNLFVNNSSPNYNDFNQYFVLKYYDIGCLPGFFASGTMFFTFNQTNIEKPLQSIYAIIPDKSLKTSYFSILIPKESVVSMNKLIEKLDFEYANDKGMFIRDIEFLLLDASQNVIINDSLYNELQINNDILTFSKVNYALVMARLPSYLEYSTSLRNYAYEQLKTIELIK